MGRKGERESERAYSGRGRGFFLLHGGWGRGGGGLVLDDNIFRVCK